MHFIIISGDNMNIGNWENITGADSIPSNIINAMRNGLHVGVVLDDTETVCASATWEESENSSGYIDFEIEEIISLDGECHTVMVESLKNMDGYNLSM